MNNRAIGVVLILTGIGLFLISIVFSSGSNKNRDFFGNISAMQIVFKQGEYHDGYYEASEWVKGWYSNRVSVPIKYPISLSVVISLIGVGIITLSGNKSMIRKGRDE